MHRLLGPGVYELHQDDLLVGVATVLDSSGARQLWALSANQSWGPKGRAHRLSLRDDAPTDAAGLLVRAAALGAKPRLFVVSPAIKVPPGGGGPRKPPHLELDPGSMSLHQDGALIGAVLGTRLNTTTIAEAWALGDHAERLRQGLPLTLITETGESGARTRHGELLKLLGGRATTTALLSQRVSTLPNGGGPR